MAGGAFTLTLVGLVVPGVPSVPFLLATSYYLARSSPRLNERLRRTAFFGPILQEWEGHDALSLTSKGKLIGLTATIRRDGGSRSPDAPRPERDPPHLVAQRLRRHQDACPHGRRPGQISRGDGNHVAAPGSLNPSRTRPWRYPLQKY